MKKKRKNSKNSNRCWLNNTLVYNHRITEEIYLYLFIFMFIFIYLYIYIFIYILYMYTYINVYTYICIYLFIYIHIYIYTYLFIFIFIFIFIFMTENKTTVIKNLWDTVKAVLSERLIAIQAYFKKQEINQINNLTLHLKQLEEE